MASAGWRELRSLQPSMTSSGGDGRRSATSRFKNDRDCRSPTSIALRCPRRAADLAVGHRPHSSDTSPPPWRSSRPAISSSRSTMRTIAGEDCDSRTRSSMPTGVGPSRRDDAVALVGLRLGERGGGAGSGSSAGSSMRAGRGSAQHGEHVGRFGDQRRALLEQAVGALGARIERRARHREHLAALLEREPRGDQRAGALAPPRPPRRRATSPEISRLRRGKSRPRGSQPSGISETAAPPCEDRVEQVGVLGRIDVVVAAGQHRDGAGREARAMRGGVDAAREAGHDDEAGVAELARERSANLTPAADALREPTTATIGAPAPRACRARQSAAARRRSCAAARG